jgi:hypothetical protein
MQKTNTYQITNQMSPREDEDMTTRPTLSQTIRAAQSDVDPAVIMAEDARAMLDLNIAGTGRPFQRTAGMSLLDADAAHVHTTDARYNGGNVTLCGRGLRVNAEGIFGAVSAGATPCPTCAEVMAGW